MTRNEEVLLVAKAKDGDALALEALLVAHRGLMHLYARRALAQGAGCLDLEDLLQEARLGLLKAVQKFDPTRGTKFATYLGYWLHQGTRRAIDTKGALIRVPVYAKQNWAQPQVLSLDYPTTTGDGERQIGFLGDLLPSDEDLENDTVDRITACTLPPQIETAIGRLPAHYRFVLVRRFGLRGYEPHRLDDIALLLGLSRQGANRIEAMALRDLRRMLGAPEPAPRPQKPKNVGAKMSDTDRELIVTLSAEGMSGYQIAKRMGRAVRTINEYLRQSKLDI